MLFSKCQCYLLINDIDLCSSTESRLLFTVQGLEESAECREELRGIWNRWRREMGQRGRERKESLKGETEWGVVIMKIKDKWRWEMKDGGRNSEQEKRREGDGGRRIRWRQTTAPLCIGTPGRQLVDRVKPPVLGDKTQRALWWIPICSPS